MILVFVGAGGSTAVDPEQYPTTVEFFKRLPKEILEDSLFQGVCKFIQERDGDKTLDIENVLEVLDALQVGCNEAGDLKTIMGLAISGRLASLSGVQDYGALQQSIGAFGKEVVVPLNNKIKEQVYTFYGTPPASEKLSVWIQLLKGLKKIDPALELFTTNYDLVLEKVINESADLKMETGRASDGIKTTLNTSFWENPGEDQAQIKALNLKDGLLTKLHGSVDWQRSNGGINCSEVFTGDHQNHCILYPGYKGEPIAAPLRAFHEHFRRVVNGVYESLSAAIFVGFAFRDAYINRVLSDLPSDTPTVFITKSDGKPTMTGELPPRAPYTEVFVHFQEGLTHEIAKRGLEFIEFQVEK